MARAPSSGATRSSSRIRNIARRDLKQRLLDSPTSGRPRTRAQKAVLAGAMGRRRSNRSTGTIYDHFLISKPGARRGKNPTNGIDSAQDTTDITDLSDDGDDSADSDFNAPAPKHPTSSRRLRRSTRTAKRRNPPKRPQRNVSLVLLDKPAHEVPKEHEIVPNWIVPAMQPHWAAVLGYAATEAGYLNRSWLLETATVCKAFAEPALTVLYSNPVITTEAKLQKFVATLCRPSNMFNYPSKVHSLHLGPRFIPTNYMIETLLIYLPRLRHFSIDHELDEPPYRDLTSMPRRNYPDFWNLLENRVDTRPGMIQKPSTLLSWKWSWRLLGSLTPDSLIQLHTTGPLRHLKSLHLVNFPSLGYTNPADDMPLTGFELAGPNPRSRSAQECAKVITPLKNLEHLVLEACFAVDGEFLSYLPPGLKHLEIIHCWNLQAAHLTEFLLTHGKNLRSLTLRNNQSLDLSFLTMLRDVCPNLEELEVNMGYFKDPETNSSNPFFDFALSEDQVPRWPRSIRHIELLHIRPWTYDAAVMFLQSLINDAKNLPNLRYLVIKSMLDLDWRKRATMRSEWLARLEAVFLQPAGKPPEPLISLQPPRRPSTRTDDKTAVQEDKDAEAGASRRRSSRISARDVKPYPSPTSSLRRPRRNYTEPPSDIEDDSSSEDDDDGDISMSDAPIEQSPKVDGDGDFTQGLCRYVELTIENHKLAEMQYDMDDFVDGGSEDSSSSDSDFV